LLLIVMCCTKEVCHVFSALVVDLFLLGGLLKVLIHHSSEINHCCCSWWWLWVE